MKLLTVAQVGEVLGFTDQSVRNLIKRGKLPAYRIGSKKNASLRVSEEQLATYLDQALVNSNALEPAQ